MSNARFSILPARAITEGRLTRTELVVLATLGMYGDRHGWCCPSSKTIAEQCSVSAPHVRQACARLVELGYLQKTPRKRSDGGQSSNEFRILFDATPCTSTGTPPVPPQVHHECTKYNNTPPPPKGGVPPLGESAAKNGEAKATTLDALQLDEALQAYAAKEAPHTNPALELKKFRQWVEANGKRYKNYRAAFRNWLLKAEGYQTHHQKGLRKWQNTTS